ncbi:hypothetical protein H8D79_00770 [PVC group bacterium]|nr:hypothetical protein [PVC group bacterium]
MPIDRKTKEALFGKVAEPEGYHEPDLVKLREVVAKMATSGGIAGPADPLIDHLREHRRIPPGTVFFTPGAADRKSVESPDWENGMLTHVVLRGLRGEADGCQAVAPMDRLVTVGELRAFVHQELPKLTIKAGLSACYPKVDTDTTDATINDLPLAYLRQD